MYCRKCMKKNKGKKKVSMNSKVEEQCYLCSECGYIVNWNTEEEYKNQRRR